MQALMGLKGIYDAKEVHIHILNKPAEGDLKRPFKAAPSMFGGKCFFGFYLVHATLLRLLYSCRGRAGYGRGVCRGGGEADWEEEGGVDGFPSCIHATVVYVFCGLTACITIPSLRDYLW